MLIFFLFSIVYCENIIKNPSFEEFDSNNKLLYWYLDEEADISSNSHSGKKSLHWKPKNKLIYSYQIIQLEDGFLYEICAYINVINAPGHGLIFGIATVNRTREVYQRAYSRGYFGDIDWKKYVS